MKTFHRIAFLLGLALFVWLVVRIGPDRIGASLREIGWAFVPVMAVSAVGLLFNAASWRAMLPVPRLVSMAAMTRMLVAAEAVTSVSPMGLAGGEVVRASLLSEHLPAEVAAASVATAAMAQFGGQVLFVLTGLPVVAILLPAGALRTAFFVVAATLGALLAAVLRLAWWEPGLERVARLARRVFPSAWSEAGPRWRRALAEALDRMRARPRRFASAVLLSLFAWQTGVAETWIVLRVLGVHRGVAGAYLIETLSVVIEGVFFFVPAKMGTQEGGRMLVFLAAGLDPADGLVLGLARRVREFAWAAVGLALLGLFGFRRPSASTATARAVSPRG